MEQEKLIRYINSFLGFNRHNGITVKEAAPGSSLVEAALTRDSLNPQGAAHGGLIYALADTAAGTACVARGRMAVTQSGSANYLRPGTGAVLRARATELHYGGKTAVYRVDVTDGQDTPVAVFTFSMFLGDRALEV